MQAASSARSAKMRPIATDVARNVISVSVCQLAHGFAVQKTAEPLEVLFRVGLM